MWTNILLFGKGVPPEQYQSLLKPMWNDVRHVSPRDLFRRVFTAAPLQSLTPSDTINNALYFEAKTFLHGLLVIEDKLSMAHGLETRVPFLDNDLVDFAMHLPIRFKLRTQTDSIRVNENESGNKPAQYFQRTRDGKLLLRSVMARHLPADVADGDKQGFSAPDGSWFKGESIQYIRKELLAPKARLYEYLDHDTVQALVDDHLQGRHNRRLLIWSLLSFEWWLRTFFA